MGGDDAFRFVTIVFGCGLMEPIRCELTLRRTRVPRRGPAVAMRPLYSLETIESKGCKSVRWIPGRQRGLEEVANRVSIMLCPTSSPAIRFKSDMSYPAARFSSIVGDED